MKITIFVFVKNNIYYRSHFGSRKISSQRETMTIEIYNYFNRNLVYNIIDMPEEIYELRHIELRDSENNHNELEFWYKGSKLTSSFFIKVGYIDILGNSVQEYLYRCINGCDAICLEEESKMDFYGTRRDNSYNENRLSRRYAPNRLGHWRCPCCTSDQYLEYSKIRKYINGTVTTSKYDYALLLYKHSIVIGKLKMISKSFEIIVNQLSLFNKYN